MNALQRLIVGAGPKVHERLYEGWFTWNNIGFPACHGEILRNPTLVQGGFSPNVLVMVTVRDELFPTSDRPSKGDYCTLQTLNETLELMIGEMPSGSGELIWKFLLWDRAQGA